MMDTCKTCRNFRADDLYVGFGDCLMMGDANKFNFMPKDRTAELDRCYGWDYESFSAGTHVGENFGCIHWEKLNGSNAN